jgi:hypothetical protein
LPKEDLTPSSARTVPRMFHRWPVSIAMPVLKYVRLAPLFQKTINTAIAILIDKLF